MMRNDGSLSRRGWRGMIAAALLVGVSACALAFALVERRAGLVLPAGRDVKAEAAIDERVGATVEWLDGGTAQSLGTGGTTGTVDKSGTLAVSGSTVAITV